MEEFAPTAKVISDSVSPAGHRLTTLEVTLHRYMLAEINTHRVFSRNSASSRAIPTHRILTRIADQPAIPTRFASERKGMQGGEDIIDTAAARSVWLAARDAAVHHAEQLVELGVHKSIVNRLLEPFMPHTVIISATDWAGFWAQRCSPLAQSEIEAAAEAMRAAYNTSAPAPVAFRDWHMPYVDDIERASYSKDRVRAMSVARCARVSYLTHARERNRAADIDLFNRLVTADPPHWSPLEHVATPCRWGGRNFDHGHICAGNFTGWHQLRHLTAFAAVRSLDSRRAQALPARTTTYDLNDNLCERRQSMTQPNPPCEPKPDAGNTENIDDLTEDLDEDDDVYQRVELINTSPPDQLEQAPDTPA